MTPKEQLEQVLATADPVSNVTVRQVSNGFVVTGQVQYIDRETKGIVANRNDEAIAANYATAATMVSNYLSAQNFGSSAPASGGTV